MKRATLLTVAISLAALLLSHGTAGATALLYRPASPGQWVGIAEDGDTRTGGAFTGIAFKSLSRVRPRIDSIVGGVCGPSAISVVAFSAQMSTTIPNTGIFLYEAGAASIVDAVIEGTATPIGGTYSSLKGVNPAIAIDQAACILHVIFRARASGGGVSSANDTAILDATFTLPGLAPGPVNVIAQENITPAPAPFPGAATFADFPTPTKVAADWDTLTNAGPQVAFRAKATGGGLIASNDSAVIAYYNGTFWASAREGDPGCAPAWAGAGSVYDEFPASLEMAMGASGFGPVPFYRARSKGGSKSTDTALEYNIAAAGCGAVAPADQAAVEGSPTPAGGTYGDFGPTVVSGFDTTGGPVFLTKVNGAPASKALVRLGGTLFGPAAVVVAQDSPDTAISTSAGVRLSKTADPWVNVNGTIVFKASIKGQLPPGLFVYDVATANPAQLLTFKATDGVIDDLGNMATRAP